MIYFDNNATTAIHPEVLEEMMPFFAEQHGNPTSNHRFGRRAHTAIEEAREKVAYAVNAHPSQIIFTASGTESNNTIIHGVADGYPESIFGYSAIEHPCVSKPVEALRKRGFASIEIPVDQNGLVNIELLSDIPSNQPTFISVMMANNETGVIQNMPEIVQWAKKNKAIVHTDAVQALGKITVDFEVLDVDALTISSHKAYGPQGVAALVVNNKIDVVPFIKGGGQERGLRSGTENLAGIIGFGKACERAAANTVLFDKTIRPLQSYLEQHLVQMGAVIFGNQVKRLPNTSFFAFPRLDGVTLLTALDKKGFAVASGSACSSNSNEPSHVLLAMGIDKELAQGAIRVSMGVETTLEQVKSFITSLKMEIERLKQLAAMAA
ncbi:MAG: cysteine desulfurase [Methylophilales bacterium BACL14 MAG-120910-bin43]|nr:MAG: cysteine desulfurase [Methylophilales bacterium BACL14 MAG-120910-bin43]